MSESLLRVGLAQIQVTTDEPERNLQTHLQILGRAREEGVDLVVFPELSLSGYLIEDPARWSEQFEESFTAAVKAEVGALTAVVGMPRRACGGGATNSAVVLDRSGIIARQDKLYLPSYGGYDEGDRFVAGSDLQLFGLKGFALAILMCEDAWHGSLAYLARLRGADVILHPAASARSAIGATFDSEDGWHTICRSEAIYYGTYIVFVNQAGVDRSSQFWGGSRVIAPAGDVAAHVSEGDELLVVELRRLVIDRGRALLPMMDFENLAYVHREVGTVLDGIVSVPAGE
jgi:N-carbamoylputrescine amidase